jgi:transposase
MSIASGHLPGIQVNTPLPLFAELGPDFVTRFPIAKCFSSWLGLCLDIRITDGKIISVKTRDVKSRAAMALRLAVQSLWHSNDYLGDVSAAGKPGSELPRPSPPWPTSWRIVRHLINYRLPYDPSVWGNAEEKLKLKKLKYIQQNAATLGYKLLFTS